MSKYVFSYDSGGREAGMFDARAVLELRESMDGTSIFFYGESAKRGFSLDAPDSPSVWVKRFAKVGIRTRQYTDYSGNTNGYVVLRNVIGVAKQSSDWQDDINEPYVILGLAGGYRLSYVRGRYADWVKALKWSRAA